MKWAVAAASSFLEEGLVKMKTEIWKMCSRHATYLTIKLLFCSLIKSCCEKGKIEYIVFQERSQHKNLGRGYQIKQIDKIKYVVP